MNISQIEKKELIFLTCCLDDWGGSEELWAKSIPFLHDKFHHIFVFKNVHNLQHPVVKSLLRQGVIFKNLNPSFHPIKRLMRQTSFLANRIKNRHYHQDSNHHLLKRFKQELLKINPQLVVISQGINFDGLRYAHLCYHLGIPYVIISHKAVDFFWPHEKDRDFMKMTLEKALSCCFVSYHNLRLTEDQFGLRLKNSRVIFNPIKIPRNIIPFPATHEGFRLACIGRLFLIDKGQDILIRVLSQKKWRARPLTVSIIGTGPDLKAIEGMIDLYQLTNIELITFQENITNLWLNHHGLILPSRSEGLPLTITEAMSAGRISIVSNAGGNGEFIEEGITGFVGEANQSSMDEAMERAWEKRYEWEEMGKNAHNFVQENIPPVPEKNFAELLKLLSNEKRPTSISNHSYV